MISLIIEDDPDYARMLRALLEKEYGEKNVQETSNLEDARSLLKDQIPELVILDAQFPRKAKWEPFFMADAFMDALAERLKNAEEEYPDIILISGQDTTAEEKNFDKIVDWLRHGKISDVLLKNAANIGLLFFQAIFKHKVQELRQQRALRLPLTQASEYLRNFKSPIYARSTSMKKVGQQIKRAGPTNASVLITGESGTGKELIAKAIHYASDRKNGPFVAVNCAAIPEGLFESELFGYRRGAFTGADRDYRGLFEAAHGGTLFLDEIGDLSVALQPKVFRALGEEQITRIGETKPRQVDVRLVTATNRDLSVAMRDKTFREELYYRIAQFRIHLPPLRERTEDIELLIEPLLSKAWKELRVSKRRSITIADFSREALEALAQYHWPGNVREMQNFIIGILINFDAGPITVSNLIEMRSLIASAEVDVIESDSSVEISNDPEKLKKQLIDEIDRKHKPVWKNFENKELLLKLLYKSLDGKSGKPALDFCKTFIETRTYDDGRAKRNPQSYLVYKTLLYLVLRSDHQTNYADLQEVLGRKWSQVVKVVNLAKHFKAIDGESFVSVTQPGKKMIVSLTESCLTDILTEPHPC